MQPTIIAVHGVKQSGKDTVLSMMAEYLDMRGLTMKVRGFADELKISLIMILFGVEVSPEVANDFFDRYKEDATAAVQVHRLVAVPVGTSGAMRAEHIKSPCLLRPNVNDATDLRVADATVRDLLTRMGTDVARDRWGKDFWAERLLPYPSVSEAVAQREAWKQNFILDDGNVADFCGIRDLRFPNEMRRIAEFGGLRVKVRRRVAEERVMEEARAAGKPIHESDMLMDDHGMTVVFDNNGTLEDLRQQVIGFLNPLI
jgi:hypothetical protein